MHTHGTEIAPEKAFKKQQNYFLHVEEPYQKFDSCEVSALVLPAEATQIMSTFPLQKSPSNG